MSYLIMRIFNFLNTNIDSNCFVNCKRYTLTQAKWFDFSPTDPLVSVYDTRNFASDVTRSGDLSQRPSNDSVFRPIRSLRDIWGQTTKIPKNIKGDLIVKVTSWIFIYIYKNCYKRATTQTGGRSMTKTTQKPGVFRRFGYKVYRTADEGPCTGVGRGVYYCEWGSGGWVRDLDDKIKRLERKESLMVVVSRSKTPVFRPTVAFTKEKGLRRTG